MRRQIGHIEGVDDQPHLVGRGDMAHRLDLRLEGDHLLRLKPRRGEPVRLPPGVGAADQGRRGEDGERPAPDRAEAGGKAGEEEGGRRQQEADPGMGVRQDEIGGDAEAEPDRKPQRQLVPLRLGLRFQPIRNGGEMLQRPRLSRPIPYARGADIHGRHRPQPWRFRA